MSKKCILLILFITGYYLAADAQKGRIVENFDPGWKFHLGDVQDAKDAAFDDAGWRNVQLPHDFSIEQEPQSQYGGANGFFPGGIGWYRKTFATPANYSGKKVYICFDGVYHRSDVWLNGKHLGFRPYGYVSFEYDLTPYLAPAGGRNVLVVRADNSNSPSSRWYSGSGIYRHVWLKAVDPVHVDLWGVYVTTPQITASEGVVQIETTVRNGAKGKQQIKTLTEIFSAKGEKVGTATQTLGVEADSAGIFKQSITVKQPVLWDLDNPALYTAVTKIKAGSFTDEVKTAFGFRTLEWDSEKGFFLNGKNMKLKGGNLHHDGGISVGAAVPERIWEMRLNRFKDIGCNFIRASHNPPAPEFLDLCDKAGLLVMDEAFDKWKGKDWFNTYSEYFDEWWKPDMQSMLQRDRNHPSIILWSLGNEVNEQRSEEGAKRLEMMVDFVHRYEPSRKVTVGMFPSEHEHNTYGFADKTDVAGYNYNEPTFAKDRQAYPNRIFLGTEEFLYYRGDQGVNVYYDERKHFWNDVMENDWIAGWTLWPGIDYIGESNRFDLKGWPTGLLDASGREKTVAGLYRAFWKDVPQLRLAVLDDGLDIDPGSLRWSSPKMIAHWNFPQYKNRMIRVHTFSNCDSVALWVNRTSLGKRAVADYANNTVSWNVPYGEGSLRAVGYKDGKEVVADELHTSGKPAEISLTGVYPSVNADGRDVALIEVFLKDADGKIVQHDDRKITYSVKGGVLLGLDNGDLRIREPHRTNSMSTYFGRCLVVVRAGQVAGEITVSAESDGLPTGSLTIPAVK